MKVSLAVASDVVGVLGIVACAAAVVARLMGSYYLLEAEAMTVFQGGVGLMVAACLVKLRALERRGAG